MKNKDEHLDNLNRLFANWCFENHLPTIPADELLEEYMLSNEHEFFVRSWMNIFDAISKMEE